MEPHGSMPVVHAGAPLEGAPCVMIMVHGRNATPFNILDLLARLDRPQVAALARMSAAVTRRVYPGMGHLVNDDEIACVRGVLDGILGGT